MVISSSISIKTHRCKRCDGIFETAAKRSRVCPKCQKRRGGVKGSKHPQRCRKIFGLLLMDGLNTNLR